jgi:hypothetical protein
MVVTSLRLKSFLECEGMTSLSYFFEKALPGKNRSLGRVDPVLIERL